MIRYCFSLISAIVAFSFYFIEWLKPSLLQDEGTLFGVLIAFICLHICLKRILTQHFHHVTLMIFIAGLITLYRTFHNDSLFLLGLIGIHGIIMLLIILTFPISSDHSHSNYDFSRKTDDK